MDKKDMEVGSIEEKQAQVGSWIKSLIETGEVGEISPDLIGDVLKSYGAEFEVSPEARKSLGQYTNNARVEGMREVWGKRFDEYKAWTGEYISQYEQEKGVSLPALKKSGRKNSGMIQFLGQLTSFASGNLSFEDFKRYTEARVHNGRCWVEDRKEDRRRVKVPTKSEPILLSSIPPEFPQAAWDKISSWKKL